MRSYLILAPTYYGDMDCNAPIRLTESLMRTYSMLSARGMRLDFAAFRYDNCDVLNESACALLLQFLQICAHYQTAPLLNLTTFKLEALVLLWIHGFEVGLHFKECDMPLVRSRLCVNLRQLYHEIQSTKESARQHSLANLIYHNHDTWLEGICAQLGLNMQKCISMAHTLHILFQNHKSMPTHTNLELGAQDKIHNPCASSSIANQKAAWTYESQLRPKPRTLPKWIRFYESDFRANPTPTTNSPLHTPHKVSSLATQVQNDKSYESTSTNEAQDNESKIHKSVMLSEAKHLLLKEDKIPLPYTQRDSSLATQVQNDKIHESHFCTPNPAPTQKMVEIYESMHPKPRTLPKWIKIHESLPHNPIQSPSLTQKDSPTTTPHIQNNIYTPKTHCPPFFISAHTLNDLEEALNLGVDYGTISPIFYDKGANQALGLDFLHAMPQALKERAFALGGVNTHERVRQIAEAGLHGFASIGYFLC